NLSHPHGTSARPGPPRNEPATSPLRARCGHWAACGAVKCAVVANNGAVRLVCCHEDARTIRGCLRRWSMSKKPDGRLWVQCDPTKLRGCRHKHKLTQQGLADKVGVDLKTIQNAEAGRRAKPDTVQWIADALGVDTEDILQAVIAVDHRVTDAR